MEQLDVFNTLNKIDVSRYVEKKNGLSYLSWANAWAEVKKIYPTASYVIYENTLPNGYVVNYFTDGKTCYVKTGVIIEGLEHIEELPVMDYKNKSIPFESVTSFDVNKAIQRSLTKALARHGLGLYIYAGEDLPEEAKEPFAMTDEMVLTLRALLQKSAEKNGLVYEDMLNDLLKEYKVDGLEKLDETKYAHLLNRLKKALQ